MKHDRIDEPVVTRVDSEGSTTTRFSGAMITRWRSTTRSRTAPARRRGSTTTRSRSITCSRGAATGGATTTVGWVTMYCGVNGPNGGAGTATTWPGVVAMMFDPGTTT